MEMKKKTNDGGSSNGLWTNEKHLSYLNKMEASFVRTMFKNDDSSSSSSSSSTLTYTSPPLDRYLPDSSESTLDLKPRENRRREMNDTRSTANDGRRNDKRMRRPRSSQDQVVPQLGSIKSVKNEENHS